MQKIYPTILLIFAIILSSCKGDEPQKPEITNHRTILVYMAACNSLGSGGFDKMDLDEMSSAVQAGDLNGGRLLVFHADNLGTSKLLEITAEGIKNLKTYSTTDGLTAVHAQRMSQVVDDAKKIAPADSYGLVLWSHGLGWLQNGISDDFHPDISAQTWGEHSGRTMNITSLQNALTGKGFDFIYFDCCYMASVEVAYELRKVTKTIIASAIELPAEGMPYDYNIAPLFAKPDADLVSAAKNTFDFYNVRMAEDRTCTMSVIETQGLDELASVSREIYLASGGKTPDGFSPQRFMTESRCWFYDMGQYYSALAENTTNTKALTERFNSALSQCIVYAEATPRLWNRLNITHHCGLSTYIPDKNSDYTIRNYNSLSWYNTVIAK